MNSTSPLESTLEEALARQLSAIIPTNPIYATLALLVLLILVHGGTWFHLSSTLGSVISKCFSDEKSAPDVPQTSQEAKGV